MDGFPVECMVCDRFDDILSHISSREGNDQMSFSDMFGSAKIDEGVETFKKTPGAVLLDVRTPAEYAQGHIPDSTNLPLDNLPAIDIAPETPLFVYCASGGRSGQAVSWLKRNGYDATNIGGIMGYHGPLE